MIQIIEKTLIGLLLIIITIGFYTSTINPLDILYIGIATNVYLIFKARKFKSLSLMFVFWLSFIVILIPYYTDGVDISGGRTVFDIPALYDKTLFNHVFFLLLVALFHPKISHHIYMKDSIVFNKNRFGFWCTISFMIFITLFGQTGANVFQAGGYATGQSETSSLNEYFLVLVPVAYYFTGNIRWLKNILYAIIIIYLLKDLSYGGRNGTLQNGLLVLILFDNKKLKYWHIISVSIVPIYLMMLYGSIRANPLLLFSSSISEILTFPFQNNTTFYQSLGTQNDVFYSSVRFLGFIDIGILKESDRFKIFLNNILAIVTPYKYLPIDTNIAGYSMGNKYSAGGGGLVSAYWYFFLGLPGVVFIAYYISFVIKKCITSKNVFIVIYCMVFLSSYARWFAYNQIIMFKLCIYGPLFYFCLKMIESVIKSFRKENVLS